ncbi:hypothetical protein GCM10008956_15070 [Deinococcus arenae]|uniref:Uncharacterized protein n=1 Tax=Deinococcus arenae TaxID=1452751 RepID=A0A8H9GQ57_9DEIO|nr:hypothetical protein [Deinococcus arenae]GGM39613.1 hypothetical protein GCM10008956_15070 [Deinococcus arenae]
MAPSDDGYDKFAREYEEFAEKGLQERAEQHGRLIKRRRLELGLKRPAFVAEIQKLGQDMSADYLNKLESGARHLSNASPVLRDAIRAVLGFSKEEWVEKIGLYTPDFNNPDAEWYAGRIVKFESQPSTDGRNTATAFTPNALGYQIPKQPLPPIPDPLIDAGIIYGDRPGMEGLKEYRWQRWMERMPHRRRPQTPEEWLSLYLDLRDKIDPPEPEE